MASVTEDSHDNLILQRIDNCLASQLQVEYELKEDTIRGLASVNW
jgi:hypothetical protein